MVIRKQGEGLNMVQKVRDISQAEVCKIFGFRESSGIS
jgi:hypothetical protein